MKRYLRFPAILRLLVCLLLVVLLLPGCTMLGLSAPSVYVTPAGDQIETTNDMAYMMSVRDIERERARGFNEAVAQSARPEQVVALTAVYFGNPGQKIDRPRTWDERALPWVQVLAPYFAGYMKNSSGESTAQVDGDNNTIVISRDQLSGYASKVVSVMPTSTKTYQIQSGTDSSANGDGTYQPTTDNSHDNTTGEVQ